MVAKKIRKFPEELSSRVIPEPSGCLETVRGSETTWGGVWRPRTLIPLKIGDAPQIFGWRVDKPLGSPP